MTEKKYKFSLQLSLDKASERPLFTGYKIHVTKSVKPEPRHMKGKCITSNLMVYSHVFHSVLSMLVFVILLS